MGANDLDIPTGLSAKGRKGAKIIKKFLTDIGETSQGGCRLFYTPQEWKNRGELYGTSGELVVVYDGGYLYSVMNGEFGWSSQTKLNDLLQAEGLYLEQSTNWYSALYTI
jgi:hypothetical protein